MFTKILDRIKRYIGYTIVYYPENETGFRVCYLYHNELMEYIQKTDYDIVVYLPNKQPILCRISGNIYPL